MIASLMKFYLFHNRYITVSIFDNNYIAICRFPCVEPAMAIYYTLTSAEFEFRHPYDVIPRDKFSMATFIATDSDLDLSVLFHGLGNGVGEGHFVPAHMSQIVPEVPLGFVRMIQLSDVTAVEEVLRDAMEQSIVGKRETSCVMHSFGLSGEY